MVRTLVSAGELSLSCARLLADWVTTLWLSRSLSICQHGQQASVSEPSPDGLRAYQSSFNWSVLPEFWPDPLGCMAHFSRAKCGGTVMYSGKFGDGGTLERSSFRPSHPLPSLPSLRSRPP